MPISREGIFIKILVDSVEYLINPDQITHIRIFHNEDHTVESPYACFNINGIDLITVIIDRDGINDFKKELVTIINEIKSLNNYYI